LRLVILGIVGTIAGLLAGIGIVEIGFMPEQASEQAVNTDRVYDIMVIVTCGIAGLVTAILVAALVLFRERRGETRVAPPVHGHHGLEVIWTAIPAVIVIALTGISWQALNDNEGGDADMAITVWGQQFDWTYDYPGEGLENIHQLVVPVNTKIDFEVQSKDVIHGFWVPAWRVQINATPGQINKLRATPNKIGDFKVVCTFICGSGHPVMGTNVQGSIPARIKVVSEGDYQKFLADQKKQAQAAAADPNAAAVAVFNTAGCGGCHAWKPAGSAGAIGPSLDGLGSQPDAQNFIRQSIEDPSAVITEGYPDQMPKDFKSKLAPEDLDVLVKALAGGTPQ
jgi:cytochrome c oxidase subunit II